MISARFLLLALAVAPVSAQAFDFNPDNTRYLGDVSYMQKKGELDGESTLGYSHTSEERYLSDGTLSPKYTATTESAAQSFTYGVTNRVNVTVTEAYMRQNSKDAYPSLTNSFNTSGFEDPDFAVRARLIPQGKAPIFFDLIGIYSPDLIDDTDASTSGSGSAGRGDQTYGGSAVIGHEMKSWTTLLRLDTTYVGKRKESIAGSTGTNEFGSHWDYALEWHNTLRLTDQIFLNGGATLDWAGDRAINKANDSPYTASSGMNTLIYLSPGYVIIPQKLTLNTEFDLWEIGNSTDTYSDHTNTWKNNQELYVGMHLRYKLF